MKNKKPNNTIGYKKIFTLSRADIREGIKSGKIRAERRGDFIFLSHDDEETYMRAVIGLQIPKPATPPCPPHKSSFLASLVPSVFRKRK